MPSTRPRKDRKLREDIIIWSCKYNTIHYHDDATASAIPHYSKARANTRQPLPPSLLITESVETSPFSARSKYSHVRRRPTGNHSRHASAPTNALHHNYIFLTSTSLIFFSSTITYYIMKLSVAIIATGITMTEASGASSSSSSKWASLRRRLSYEKIAGYNPGSQVRLLLLC